MGHYAPMPRGRWLLASLFPFGWVTWAGFVYAGFRAKRPAWVAPARPTCAIARDDRRHLARRGHRRARGRPRLPHDVLRLGRRDRPLVAEPQGLPAAARLLEDPALQAARLAEERQAYARELAQRDPGSRARPQIGRSGGFDEGGVVDVNHAPIEDIADLPASTPPPRAGSSPCATASAASRRSRTSASPWTSRATSSSGCAAAWCACRAE